jgi:hypothetical protein
MREVNDIKLELATKIHKLKNELDLVNKSILNIESRVKYAILYKFELVISSFIDKSTDDISLKINEQTINIFLDQLKSRKEEIEKEIYDSLYVLQ